MKRKLTPHNFTPRQKRIAVILAAAVFCALLALCVGLILSYRSGSKFRLRNRYRNPDISCSYAYPVARNLSFHPDTDPTGLHLHLMSEKESLRRFFPAEGDSFVPLLHSDSYYPGCRLEEGSLPWLVLQRDLSRFREGGYDSAFLSMFPISGYQDASYAEYLGQRTIQSRFSIPNFRTLREYMRAVNGAEPSISTIYLGLRPENIDADRLTSLIGEQADTSFEIVSAYPSVTYWSQLSEDRLDTVLNAYYTAWDRLVGLPNVFLYTTPTEEWLIANPGNYTSRYQANASVSNTLSLLCFTDKNPLFFVTAENLDSVREDFSETLTGYRQNPLRYADLSGCEIVFFGDSILANFTDSSSISGIVHSFTGASTYLVAAGGTCAAANANHTVSLATLVTAFLTQDASVLDEDSVSADAIRSYARQADVSAPHIFVINYGLNDFYEGNPVSSSDPLDPGTYAGAMYAAVTELQAAYPDAKIIIQTPSFTSLCDNGTAPQGENGAPLTEYRDAAMRVADELGVICIDNYTELGITQETEALYLSDGTHPNSRGLFLFGVRLTEELTEIAAP